LHWICFLLLIREYFSQPHRSQVKPRPQRISNSIARHCSSVPNRARNAGSLNPRTFAANLMPASIPIGKRGRTSGDYEYVLDSQGS
jgi:hypothetical protein